MSGSYQESDIHREAGVAPSERTSVSLVVATCNRVAELERLLASLDTQSYKDFEIIVVDQNPDDRLVPLLQRHPGLAIRHLRCELGLSRARNVGLHAAEGKIVAIPDDDCWYPNQLLANVVQWFESHPECDGLLTGIRNANHKLMAPKFPPPPGPCTRKSVMRCAGSVNAFMRNRLVRAVGSYRENLGLGSSSPYQSGEDLDYMIRSVDRGLCISYQPILTVYHPELSPDRLDRRAYSYALGVGYVWRLNGYSWWWCFGEIALRSIGGAVFQLCRGNLKGSYTYLTRAAGQFRGYTSRFNEPPASGEVQPITDDHG